MVYSRADFDSNPPTAFVRYRPADLVLLVGPVAGLDEVDLAGEPSGGLDVAEAVQVDPAVGAAKEVVDASRYLVPLVHLHVRRRSLT